MINMEGENSLSMRKLAARCGVTQAAPYSHFANKEALVNSIQEYIDDQLMEVLEAATGDYEPGDYEAIVSFGENYIKFFIEHPSYYRFLFTSKYLKIRLTVTDFELQYPPFALFKKYAFATFNRYEFPKDSYIYKLTNMWGTIQGITQLATSENVIYAGNWKRDLKRILNNE